MRDILELPELGTLQFSASFVRPVGTKSPIVASAERRALLRWNDATRAWVRRVVSIRQARAAATQRGEPMPYVDFIREQRAALATGARAAIVVKLQADQPDDPAGRAAEERLIRDILGADPGRLELSRTARKTALLRAVERRLAVARREVRA